MGEATTLELVTQSIEYLFTSSIDNHTNLLCRIIEISDKSLSHSVRTAGRTFVHSDRTVNELQTTLDVCRSDFDGNKHNLNCSIYNHNEQDTCLTDHDNTTDKLNIDDYLALIE